MCKWIWRSLQATQIGFLYLLWHLKEPSSTSRSVQVPAAGITSPFAVPKWTWKGFQTGAPFEALSLVSSTNFMLLLPSVISQNKSPLCHLVLGALDPYNVVLSLFYPSLPTFLLCSLDTSLRDKFFMWYGNMVLSLGHHLLCSSFKWRLLGCLGVSVG